MKHIWAPWRIEYILREKPKGCVFCEKSRENRDAENYLLFRGEKNFIILNAYPYNPGHLMVVPYRHTGNLEELSAEEFREHFEIVRKVVKALREALSPAGFNVGLNLGRAAGGGIQDHLHTHIVPRWGEDTNFMVAVADVKIVTEALAASYQKIKTAIDQNL